MVSQIACAGGRDFTLQNDTPFSITAVYFSNVHSNRWYPMRMRRSINSGDSTDVTFDSEGDCQVQVKVRFDNDDNPEWDEGFDLCSATQLTITFNAHRNIYNIRSDE